MLKKMCSIAHVLYEQIHYIMLKKTMTMIMMLTFFRHEDLFQVLMQKHM
jgi:hypothetical protein